MYLRTIEILSPAIQEDLTRIVAELPENQLFNFRIQQLGGILNFPEYPLVIDLDNRSLLVVMQ